MPDASCNLRIEDSLESAPFTLVDDVVVVVRTPRSNDFVTVEVGDVLDCRFPSSAADGVVRAPRPGPWIANGWCGEVHLGEEVDFELRGRSYHLRLERSDASRWGPPWAAYEFRLRRTAGEPATAG